jgi:recombinational DNA repair ATPase RecF
VSIQDDIYRWVRGFDPWKQELYLRAAAGPEISQADVGEVTGMLLGETVPSGSPRTITPDDLPGAARARSSMALLALSNLVNVNALADGQTLKFAPDGINVVYGRNGAGKTGYARVLKHSGRTLHRETVLTNVAGATGALPEATITVAIDGLEQDIRVDLEAPPPPSLGQVWIADSKAGEEYLTSETEVDYAPITLSSIRRLGTALKAVDAELERRLTDARPDVLDTRPFGESTRTARFLEQLSAETTDAAVIALATLSDAETEDLHSLRRTRGEIQARQTPVLRASAERDADAAAELLTALQALAQALGPKAAAAARERNDAFVQATRAAEIAARSLAAEPVAGTGDQPWRLLWESARSFANHHGHDFPPEDDPARCPLCMQELSDDAKDRLRRFERFVRDDVNTRLATAERSVRAGREAVPDIDSLRVRHAGIIDRVSEDSEPLAAALGTWLEEAGVRAAALRAGELANLSDLASEPAAELQGWIAARRAAAQQHASLEDRQHQERVERELAELEARALLAQRQPEILAHLARLREVQRLKDAKAKTRTSAISTKMTALSRELIEANLQDALNHHLRALDFDGLAVEAKSKTVRGTPCVALRFTSVSGVPLTSVLSQGEQRRVALAMFLAEMEVQGENSPVVLDDPASSIDQEGRRHIARTLGALAGKRQVIVFTHELAFLQELRRQAPAEVPVNVQYVRRVGGTTGHVHDGLPWEGLKASQRVQALHNAHRELRELHQAHDLERYLPCVTNFCMLLRSSFERAVEERVLAGVVTRQSDTIHMTTLRSVNCSEKVCDLVDRGVDENSPWMHDRAPGDGVDPPTPDELHRDLEIYEELLKTLKSADRARHKKHGAGASTSAGGAGATPSATDGAVHLSDAEEPRHTRPVLRFAALSRCCRRDCEEELRLNLSAARRVRLPGGV